MTNEEAVKKCYANEDDKALSCIKEVIKHPEPGCTPRMILLVREGCDGCLQEKERYAGDIKTGLVNVVDILSEQGKEIARRNEIDFVPALLIVDCGDKAIE
jgi:hypothetical protein